MKLLFLFLLLTCSSAVQAYCNDGMVVVITDTSGIYACDTHLAHQDFKSEGADSQVLLNGINNWLSSVKGYYRNTETLTNGDLRVWYLTSGTGASGQSNVTANTRANNATKVLSPLVLSTALIAMALMWRF